MKHISAGLVIISNDKILLVQQSNDPNRRHLSIPKGLIEGEEPPLDAAIRETYEETGVLLRKEDVNTTPYLMNIDTDLISRRIIYYVAYLNNIPKIDIKDNQEIIWAGFLTYKESEFLLQITQMSVLFHLNRTRISKRYTEWLCMNGYLSCEKHFEYPILIYNYCQRCKKDEYWDEVTMWCRGLITDLNNNILYRPLKKFFEISQMFPNFLPNTKSKFQLLEKKDGCLGILYWVNNIPFMATRGSFASKQAILGTAIFYEHYSSEIKLLNPNYTYLFEIVTPKDKHIVDYGNTEDLFLIGAYDNSAYRDIELSEFQNLSFSKVKSYTCHADFDSISAIDRNNEEGFVAIFENGFRLKIKFKSYKIKHAQVYK